MKNIDYFYLLLCVSGMSVGQLLFKKAALSMPVFSLPEILKNSWFLLAIGLYGITTLGWVWILRFIPLSLAYPMMSLAFVLVRDPVLRERFQAALRSFALMVSPLSAALATQWILGGSAYGLMEGVRKEARLRHRMARDLLAGRMQRAQRGNRDGLVGHRLGSRRGRSRRAGVAVCIAHDRQRCWPCKLPDQILLLLLPSKRPAHGRQQDRRAKISDNAAQRGAGGRHPLPVASTA